MTKNVSCTLEMSAMRRSFFIDYRKEEIIDAI